MCTPAGAGKLRAHLISWRYVVKQPSQALLTAIGTLWVSVEPQNLLSTPGESGASGGNSHFVSSHWSCVTVAHKARLGIWVLCQGPWSLEQLL